MRKSLVSMICVLLLALATTAPVWAAPPTADGGGAPRFSLVSEVLSWFLDLLPAAPQDGPQALPAAGNGNGGTGGTTTDGGTTTTCEICVGAEGRYIADPNG